MSSKSIAVALTLLLACASGSALAQSPTVGSQAKSGTAMTKAATPKVPPLDINSASKADLMALPGVGDKRADAIIKGRPYKGKDDLVQKNILPQSVYNGIRDRIIAKQK